MNLSIDCIINNIILQNEKLKNIIDNGLIKSKTTILEKPDIQRLRHFQKLILNLKNNLIKCKKNINVNITSDDLNDIYIKQKGKCALSKQNLTFNYEKYNKNRIKVIKKINEFNISISRIDNSKLYDKENVQLLACRINLMKNTLSNSKFLELCESVVKNKNICKI